MSYDINVVNQNGEVVPLYTPLDVRGGTFAVGGTHDAWLNITYNYSKYYYDIFGEDGIRSLYGRPLSEVVPLLEEAILKLGTNRTTDYWAATPGNAGAALLDLLRIILAAKRSSGGGSGLVLRGD